MFRDGKPRYWIKGYDGPFLIVPLLLALTITAIAWLPKPPPPRQNVTPIVTRPMAPTLIFSPPAGSIVAAGQDVHIYGSAETNSIVLLALLQNGVESRTGELKATNGLWGFRVGPLNPGAHTFRASAFLGGRTQISGEVTYLAKIVPRQPAAKRPANGKAAPQKPAPKR